LGAFQVSDKQLVDGLAQLGWREASNLRVDDRLAGSNDPAIIRPHAESLVRAAPDVIYASPATVVQVLQRLTSTIPIVFVQNGDPVQAGIVQSLARPGGNITGFMAFEPSINTKYLQLLKDIAPQMARVAVLQTEASRTARGGSDFAVIERAARSLAITAASLLVRDDPDDIARAIVDFGQEPNGGLILPPDATTIRHRGLIAPLAIKHGLPSVGNSRLFVEAGGLMYYAAAPVDYRRVAAYVDRILRGSNPSELPVEAPTTFKLVVNLKTAKALGLAVPLTLLATADEVIE
jgi:putative ABC transport system substrate-binding protein